MKMVCMYACSIIYIAPSSEFSTIAQNVTNNYKLVFSVLNLKEEQSRLIEESLGGSWFQAVGLKTQMLHLQ